MIARIEFENQVQLNLLSIPCLMAAQITVPFTDRLNDGKTPFNFPLQGFIGGACVDGPFATFLAAVIPGEYSILPTA